MAFNCFSANKKCMYECIFVCRWSGLGRYASNWARPSGRNGEYATRSVSGRHRLRHRHHLHRLSDGRSWLHVRSVSRAGLHRGAGVSRQVAAQSTSSQAVRRASPRRRALSHVCRFAATRPQLRYAMLHFRTFIHSFIHSFVHSFTRFISGS